MDDNRPDKQTDRASRERPLEVDNAVDYSATPLRNGTQVDHYVVGKLVCSSFSGFTYAAMDAGERQPLVIQEYFPEEVSVRDVDRVSLLLRDETVSNEFEFGLTRFYRLTRALAQSSGKGRVVASLEYNDTAYYVVPFDYRCTLKDVLQSGKRVPGSNIENWLKACLRYLVTPHEANLLHLGIQADSLLLDGEGDAILVGFNSVGPAFHTEPHKPEYLYLPIERIRSEAEMIPASDLYSLAAVLLHAMSGEPPAHAARRTGAVSTGRADPVDEQLRGIENEYAPGLLRVLKWMLAPQPGDRPQSALEALDALDASAGRAVPTVRAVAQKPDGPSRANLRSERHPVRPASHKDARTETREAKGRDGGRRGSSPADADRAKTPATPTIGAEPVPGRPANEAGGPTKTAPASERPAGTGIPTVTSSPAPGTTPRTEPARSSSQPASRGHDAPIQAPRSHKPATDPHLDADSDAAAAPMRQPQNWFADADGESHRRNPFAAALTHPVSWVGAVLLALVGAWLWLGGESPFGTDEVVDSQPLPRINVVPEGESASRTASSDRPVVPEVVLESASSITGANDNQRFAELRKLDALERRLEPHLMEARTHLENGRLVAPENGNALAAFQQVLALDPGNPEALQGIDGIHRRLAETAADELAAGNLEAAEQEIGRLAAIDAEHAEVGRIRGAIAQIRLQEELAAEAARQQAAEEERQRLAAEQRQAELEQRQAELQSLMGRAMASFDAGKLVEPPLDNALFYYREMLKIDPQSQSANAGIEQIAAQFVRQARQGLAANDLNAADRNLTTAAAIDPANTEIPPVREQIDTRRRLAEQEQQALAEVRQSQEKARQAAQSQAEMSLQSGIGAYYRGDYAEAYSFLRPLAENGDARAQFRLAVMLQNGRGVATNRAEARKWFLAALEPIRMAAGSGSAWAQADLGSYYEDGIILDANYREAARWYLQAAEQGYAGAQTNLGVMYANGQGVEPDMSRAIEWFKRAAIQGDSVAKENLRILGHNPDRISLGASG